MSTKKRFTIAPDLASGLRNTIQSAATNQGQLHYDLMPIDMIETDPNNPRRLALTKQDILYGVHADDAQFTIKTKERDALTELSESIKRIGIRNAIEVYKDGLKYRIITGERRYWAAILAGQKSVPVRIGQKPDEFNLRYTQWVENINRQDLSLWEKLTNLHLIANAYKQTNQQEINEQILQSLLGVSNTQAYRYFCLLKAEESITSLIQQGKVNNLKIVQELVSMKDKGARNQIISWVSTSLGEITSLTQYRDVAGKRVRTSPLKSKTTINLGKVTNTLVAKYLLDRVLSDARFSKYRDKYKHLDWHSSKAVNHAFKDLLKLMDLELRVEEIA